MAESHHVRWSINYVHIVIRVAKWSYRLLLVLLISVKGLPCSVSRVGKHVSVLPVYFKLQPAEVNCYTGLVLERFETLPLLDTKYVIYHTKMQR